MKIGQLIKNYRDSHDLSQRQLANRCGLSNGYISILEKGMNPKTGKPVVPTLPQIKKLADGMGMTTMELMEQVDDMPIDIASSSDAAIEIPAHPQFLPMPAMKKWRVIGATACGEPMHRDLEEFVFAPDSINADLVFRCEGDSMIGAHILDGDIAFVRTCEVEDGQIAVVRVEDDYSLKRIYRGPDYLELRSENPKYPPIIIRGEQANAEIIGRVVFFITRPL